MRNFASVLTLATVLAAGATGVHAADVSKIEGLQAVSSDILFFNNGDQLRLPGRILDVERQGNDLIVEYDENDDGSIKTTVIDLSAWS